MEFPGEEIPQEELETLEQAEEGETEIEVNEQERAESLHEISLTDLLTPVSSNQLQEALKQTEDENYFEPKQEMQDESYSNFYEESKDVSATQSNEGVVYERERIIEVHRKSGEKPVYKEERYVVEGIGVGDDTITDYEGADDDNYLNEIRPKVLERPLDEPTEEEAYLLAQLLLSELDTEVDDYFEKHHPTQKRAVRRESSLASIDSSLSMYDPNTFYIDEPSTMDLYYEKFETDYRANPNLHKIRKSKCKDAWTQDHLHRPGAKKSITNIPKVENLSQTKEMAFITSSGQAEMLFRHIYPIKDHYVPPPPPTRQASMEASVAEAQTQDLHVDRVEVGPKTKWDKKLRRLPPVTPRDYHKVEYFWTGSVFSGRYVNRQFDHGKFDYPLMSTYESEFKDGKMHSINHLGIVKYPRGDTFVGHWRRGRHLAGHITFHDELEYKQKNWTYCVPPDRRFYIERDIGMKQAGRTLYSDHMPPPIIPSGHYDTGDGSYNPKTHVITGYGGQILRKANKKQHKYIMEHYRKQKVVQERSVNCFNENRLPCSYAENYVKQSETT